MLFLYIFLLFFEVTAEVKSPSVWGDYRQEVSGSLQFAREIVVPEKLRGLYKQKKIRVFAIDLDSDKKTDYIVHEVGAYNTCYFSHAFERKNCEKLGYAQGGFDYRFFAQLDSDPMLELFMFSGFGDGSDYKLYKFDSKTWSRKLLFPIHPLLIPKSKDKTGIFWGYPWNIQSLEVKKDQEVPKITATFRYRPSMLDAEEPTPEELRAPGLYFNGTATQGGNQGHLVDDRKLYTLDELVKEYHSRIK